MIEWLKDESFVASLYFGIFMSFVVFFIKGFFLLRFKQKAIEILFPTLFDKCIPLLGMWALPYFFPPMIRQSQSILGYLNEYKFHIMEHMPDCMFGYALGFCLSCSVLYYVSILLFRKEWPEVFEEYIVEEEAFRISAEHLEQCYCSNNYDYMKLCFNDKNGVDEFLLLSTKISKIDYQGEMLTSEKISVGKNNEIIFYPVWAKEIAPIFVLQWKLAFSIGVFALAIHFSRFVASYL